MPEHYDEHWQILPDYNRDQPRHAFRPYGVTPGHGFEWARLLLHLGTRRPNDAYLVAAQGLFDTALRDGWSEDKPGIAYTTDWDGVPVVRERFHWVLCEAIATAAVLADATGESRYDEWYARWWQLAEDRFIDLERGGWVPELDEDGRRSKGTWSGKADWYHAVQATLIPRLPLTSSIAASVTGRQPLSASIARRTRFSETGNAVPSDCAHKLTRSSSSISRTCSTASAEPSDWAASSSSRRRIVAIAAASLAGRSGRRSSRTPSART